MNKGQIELYKPTARPTMNLPIIRGVNEEIRVKAPPIAPAMQTTSSEYLIYRRLTVEKMI